MQAFAKGGKQGVPRSKAKAEVAAIRAHCVARREADASFRRGQKPYDGLIGDCVSFDNIVDQVALSAKKP